MPAMFAATTTLLLVALARLGNGSPVPQDIAYAVVASPIPSPTMSVGVASQVVPYDPHAAAAQVAAALRTEPLPHKVKKRTTGTCAAQPVGAGPVPSPDTPAAFEAYQPFAAAASSAPTPPGYNLVFTNLNASNNANAYMGFTTLQTYDTLACATQCTATAGCSAINIYFERDPTLDPGPNCPNPPSTTNIKCVFWGGPVSAANANNFGQSRDNFEVVIAGSNGYTISSAPSITGYGPPSSLGTNAINAPLDCNGYDTYMGFKVFNSGTPFDPNLCAAACSAQTAYNAAHPSPGQTPQVCEFFNTYILYDNGVSQGQYCVLYNETWSNSYATNSGYWSGTNHFTIDSSYTYSATNAPTTCVKNSPAPNCSGPTGNGGNGIISGQVLNSASACSAACQTTAGCNMFSWGYDQPLNVNICFLYSTTIATSGYTPSASAALTYYDAACTNFKTSTSCSSGAAYTAYPNPITNPYGVADPNYAPFSASSYNPPSTSPSYTGAIADINFAVPGSGVGPAYGSSTFNSTYTTFVYHAFLIAPQDGSYTFTFQNVDDVAYLWEGSKAFSTWSESNYDVKAVFRNTPGSKTMSLVAGTCYPVTILFANAQGASVLDFTVTLPDGTAVTDTTGLLVQPSCSKCSSLGTFV